MWSLYLHPDTAEGLGVPGVGVYKYRSQPEIRWKSKPPKPTSPNATPTWTLKKLSFKAGWRYVYIYIYMDTIVYKEAEETLNPKPRTLNPKP